MPPPNNDPRYQILVLVGIIDQLVTTRANQLLADSELPLAQFSMLNHFSHAPDRALSVGEVAAAFQVPQPGVTKMLQRLVKKGLLAVSSDPVDGRIKRHRLTTKGLAARSHAIERLLPDIARLFGNWSTGDIADLETKLARLKDILDRERAPNEEARR